MEFDYDFSKCHICGNQMINASFHIFTTRCPNGCCTFRIDPQENVAIYFWGERITTIALYEETLHDKKSASRLKRNLQYYLKKIAYWKENDRYLAEILTRR